MDEYEPIEEGLDKVVDTRSVSVIEIKLSKECCQVFRGTCHGTCVDKFCCDGCLCSSSEKGCLGHNGQGRAGRKQDQLSDLRFVFAHSWQPQSLFRATSHLSTSPL